MIGFGILKPDLFFRIYDVEIVFGEGEEQL